MALLSSGDWQAFMSSSTSLKQMWLRSSESRKSCISCSSFENSSLNISILQLCDLKAVFTYKFLCDYEYLMPYIESESESDAGLSRLRPGSFDIVLPLPKAIWFRRERAFRFLLGFITACYSSCYRPSVVEHLAFATKGLLLLWFLDFCPESGSDSLPRSFCVLTEISLILSDGLSRLLSLPSETGSGLHGSNFRPLRVAIITLD